MKKPSVRWVIAGLAIIMLMFTFYSIGNRTNKFIEESHKLGEDFYIQYFYDSQAQAHDEIKFKNMLQENSEKGFQVSINTMLAVEQVDSSARKYFAKSSCDLDESFVIIYPISEFEKDDFKIKVLYDCFD